MGQLPPIFRTEKETLVNVNFTDFATGKGVVDFFMGNVTDENRMSPTAFYSHKIFIQGIESSGGTDTKCIDADFDASFLRNITIDGEALVTLPFGVTSGANSQVAEVYVVVYIRKWDGTTETDLVTKQGNTYPVTLGLDNNAFYVTNLSLDIPKTTFKSGESLRVTIEIWCKKLSGSGSIQPVLCNDPKGRLVNSLENWEEWAIGTAGREIDLSRVNSPLTICSIQVPIKV